MLRKTVERCPVPRPVPLAAVVPTPRLRQTRRQRRGRRRKRSWGDAQLSRQMAWAGVATQHRRRRSRIDAGGAPPIHRQQQRSNPRIATLSLRQRGALPSSSALPGASFESKTWIKQRTTLTPSSVQQVSA